MNLRQLRKLHNQLLDLHLKIKHENMEPYQYIPLVKEIFPDFTDTPHHDTHFKPTPHHDPIREYKKLRGWYEDPRDAANAACIPSTVMEDVLAGRNVSLEVFVAVVKAEIYGPAQLKFVFAKLRYDRRIEAEKEALGPEGIALLKSYGVLHDSLE